MNHTPSGSSPHQHPSIPDDNTNPFYLYREDVSNPNPNKETNPFLQEQQQPHLYPPVTVSPPTPIPIPDHNMKIPDPVPQQVVSPSPPPAATASVPSSSSTPPPPQQPMPAREDKWGTCVMGTPAVPTVHPDNKKAALWGANGEEAHLLHHPYLQYSPIDQRPATGQTGAASSSNSSPMESMLTTFNSWSNKAETMASNIWHNLKTGPSVSGAAWAKVNLRAKAITGGGFESIYRQSFSTFPNETLNKTFACYLSTSTGPVAGTLYLSNIHAAFCSDCPLSFTAPSGQVTWSYYKVFVPLAMIGAVNPVVMRENPSEKYIQIVTLEGHDFWFMGFVNYEKACRHLTDGVAAFAALGVPVHQPPPNAATHP